jgi:hypothetical protein
VASNFPKVSFFEFKFRGPEGRWNEQLNSGTICAYCVLYNGIITLKYGLIVCTGKISDYLSLFRSAIYNLDQCCAVRTNSWNDIPPMLCRLPLVLCIYALTFACTLIFKLLQIFKCDKALKSVSTPESRTIPHSVILINRTEQWNSISSLLLGTLVHSY